MKTDFRYTLRQDTRGDHDRLDQSITALDITDLSGFERFVRLHLACFLAIQTRLSSDCRCTALLNQMVSDLRSDLILVSENHALPVATLPKTLDPLAIDYMIAGSRLGTKVLHKSWARSVDPVVQTANEYFGRTVGSELWQDTCQALAMVPATSARARTITADTQVLFRLFTSILDRLTDDQDAHV